MSLISVIMNLQNRACSQYGNFDFNSFCKIGDTVVAASDDGLFTLGGDDDNGDEIESDFELVTSDFGIENLKRIRSAYVGGRMDGDLTLTLEDDEGNSRNYTLEPPKTDRQTGCKVVTGRDGLGRFFTVSISNVDGSDFRVDSISITPIILGKKPRVRSLNTWAENVDQLPSLSAAVSE